MVLLKPLYFLLIGVLVSSILLFLVFLPINKENISIDNTKSINYFSDNVTRSATMNVSKKQNDTGHGLSANMLIQLDVIGKTDAIHIYPIIVPWGNDTTNTVTLEDGNHIPIVIKSGCNYDCGTFQTILIIPSCVTGQGETLGRIKVADNPILLTSDHVYDRIFAKYVLPDILPENGKYHIKFVSPYYVRINLPEDSRVLSNQTTTCTVSNMHKNTAFTTDVTFELQ